MRIIEVKLKDGRTLYIRAQFPASDLDPDSNGANEAALILLKQLPAELLATPPRFIYDR